MEKLLGLPPLASVHGAEIDYLIGLVHWLMLVLAVGWGIYFFYTLFKFRASRQPKADYKGIKSHFPFYLAAAVAVVELVLEIGVASPIWAAVRDELPSEDEATVVRVVAEQFAWNIHYPGADGIFGKTRLELVDSELNPIGLDRDDPYGADDITTINQLHLPVNKPVLIQLSSKDVIHSFSLPVMRVKQDAIPGMEIPVWFEPDITGDWEIACAQLCGLGHYRMRGFITVETEEEFAAWLASEAEYLGAEDEFWF